MVLDGIPGPAHELVGPPHFSSTGRLAYLTKTGDAFSIVFDGIPGPVMEEPTQVGGHEAYWISPDGDHVATVGRLAGGWRPIVDQRIGPAYPGIGRITFGNGRATFLASRPDGLYRVSTALDGSPVQTDRTPA
jgi:hypothetical protein